MKTHQQSKINAEKTSSSLRRIQSGRLSSTALTNSQFTNLHNLSLSSIDTNRQEVLNDDIPKNDWAPMAAVLDFLPTALLCSTAVSVTTLFTLLFLSCDRGLSVAISTGSGVLTLFGLCSYKKAQASAQQPSSLVIPAQVRIHSLEPSRPR